MERGEQEEKKKGVADEFRRFLEGHQGEKHIVVVQDYPDPDAISSALAYQTIARQFGIRSDIVYLGEVSHPENKALIRVLEIELIAWTSEFEVEDYDGAVFVDNQAVNTALWPKLKDAGVKPLAIIDHHSSQGAPEVEYSDVRSVGAAATIFAEYMNDGLLDLEPGRQSHARLATALMHGIRTDTANLVNARPEDFSAAAYLSHYVSASLLQEILGVKRSPRVMEGIAKALSTRRQVNHLTLAGVGFLRKKDRDIIPQVADFLITEEDVHTVVVYGVVMNEDGSESIVGSLRSSKLTLSPDEFLKDALGVDQAGNHYGGGRRNAGGFEIPLGFISGSFDEDYDQLKWQLVERKIQQVILGKMGSKESL
jgi:nanoRNase/pAp phosphatase (c-di-AMP/oligoRNAs hydrolase)